MLSSCYSNVIAARRETTNWNTSQPHNRDRIRHSARSESSIHRMLSISTVVTVSSEPHSAEAATSPDWLWERDSVQSASPATDCWKTQPILWQIVKYSIRALGYHHDDQPCDCPMIYLACSAGGSRDVAILPACVCSSVYVIIQDCQH